MFKYLVFLSLFFAFAGCHFQSTNEILGAWVGDYQEIYGMDYPAPMILDFKRNGQVEIQSFYGDKNIRKWKLDHDVLQIDSMNYTISTLSDDALKIMDRRVQVFKKLSDQSQKINIDSFRNLIIESKYFKSDSLGKILSFGDSTIISWTEEKTEKRCFDFFEFKGNFFLYQYGQKDHCEKEFIGNVFQILNYSKKGFSVRSFYPDHGVRVNYQALSSADLKPEFESDSFQRCGFGGLYFHKSIIDAHEKSGRFIESHFLNRFNESVFEIKDGFLAMKFVVNCEGEIGNFYSEFIDENYRGSEIELSIFQEFKNEIIRFGGWKPYDINGFNYDSLKSMIFRFESGRLISVNP